MAALNANEIIALFRLLSNEANVRILKAIKERKECYVLELEKDVGLDRSTIKKRLYAFMKLGLLKSREDKTPKKGRATYYSYSEVMLPKIKVSDILDNFDTNEVKAITRIK